MPLECLNYAWLAFNEGFFQQHNLAGMIQRTLNDAVEQDVNQRTAVHGGFLEPGLRDVVTDVIASKRTVQRGIFQASALKRALLSLDAYSPGERMHHQEFMRLWILYVIEEWIRRNCDN